VARLAAALLCVFAFSGEASARTELLRWTHPNPSTVTGFNVRWVPSGGSTTLVSAGLPVPDASGVYSFNVTVPDSADVWFTVSAFNAGGESPGSNAICRGTCSTSGGTTSGGTGGTTGGGTTGGGTTGGTTGPQAAIAGFKLWNASTDTVLDSNFVSNDVIATGNNCVAIEIVGNGYLNAGSGSLMKTFKKADGTTLSGCENAYPFGWEDDAGVGRFDCALSLVNSGTTTVTDTLTVAPYDGKNCTGTAGTPVVLTFGVAGGQSVPTTPPTNTPTLTAPGKPTLVGP